jgi:TolA-binding protein
MIEHDDDGLRELGKQLPWHRPDPASRDAVREAVLAAAEREQVRGRARWATVFGAFGVGALAAAAAMLLVVRGEQHPAAPVTQVHAQVEASSAADFERQVSGDDEIVRVKSGKLRVAADQHARIATGDAIVDGIGAYEVVVTGDRIREVDVRSGAIAVRVSGEQAVFLGAGSVWRAKPQVVAEDVVAGDRGPAPGIGREPEVKPQGPAPAPAQVVRDTPSRRAAEHLVPAARTEAREASSPSAADAAAAEVRTSQPPEARTSQPEARTPPEATPEVPAADPEHETESHFAAGWQLLKAGKPAEAARELAAAADAGGSLANDARYFQGVALTRAGRKTEAEHTLVTFLDAAPRSLRRGRAAVMLARLIAERGDSKAARAWFESALQDPDQDVAAAARAGIAGLR